MRTTNLSEIFPDARSTSGWKRAELLALAVAAGAIGCAQSELPRHMETVTVDASESPATDSAAPSREAEAAPPPKPETRLTDAAAPPYEGPLIGAMFMDTPVMSDMEWLNDPTRPKGGRSTVMRLGYLRHGGKVPVIPEAHRKPNCLDGWYELVSGGFVCGKHATLDLNHPRVKLAPHSPNMDGPLPYEYGYNLTNGTPIYRTIPSQKERIAFEPWLRPQPKARRPSPASEPADDSSNGAALGQKSDPLGVGSDGAETTAVPWYLRTYDGGKPQVTLDDLRGEGPILRRMVRGFYLALDKEFKTGGATKWWRTTGGYAVPFDRVYVQKPLTEFHGVWINQPSDPAAGDGDAGAPDPLHVSTVAFVTSTKAHKYIVSLDSPNPKKRGVATGELVARLTAAPLTGKTFAAGGATYHETVEGWWFRQSDGHMTRPGPPPSDLAPGEKWIDVDLTSQTLLAFEGDTPVYATLISSGRRNMQVKDKDHATPTGTFRIREKHVAATMDGDVASDGPYSIEDVPWIMYFKGSYALHGAFWHADFGHMHSHGCVNLAPADARAMFGWSDPPLPQGWHGVYATDDHQGTRVVVHDETVWKVQYAP